MSELASESAAQPPANAPAREAGRGMTPDELRSLFLFESLTDDQLRWLSEQGRVEEYPAGDVLREGEPAELFLVLLAGTVALSRRSGQSDIEVNRSNHAGSYMGATQGYLNDDQYGRVYTMTVRAITPCRFFVLPGLAFGQRVREWFPMAIHLLEGLLFGMRNSQAAINQRERLSALGSLTAGLMHELNNPAAAAGRATVALRQRVAGMRMKLGKLADGRITQEQLVALTQLQESVIERAAKAPTLSAMEASDREDELSDWMDDNGVSNAWDLAPIFAQGGMDLECMEDIKTTVADPVLLEKSLQWLGYALETEQLMTDIEDATARVSSLVTAAKQYSQMDRASYQVVNIHEGLKSTLVMLNHKIGDITVVKDFDRTLPKISAHPAELNQVWTNLIDNAVQAMKGQGTLTVSTSLENDCLLVEVRDTGTGIPAEVLPRVFEPFFTTKPVGEGTGLGLDISYRIVVNRHGGDISVTSQPGDTRFQVRLPISEPKDD
jgi:signal transduction histidine kinase